MKKMFITDLDGTLFTDDKKIDICDLKSLDSLGEIGVIRVFATGRSLYSLQKAVEKIGFTASCEDMPVDYVIFSTGAGIMECKRANSGNKAEHNEDNAIQDMISQDDNDNIIIKHSLESEDVNRIADYFDSLKLDYMIHRPIPDTPYCIYRQQSKSVNSDFNCRLELYRDFCTSINHSGPVRDFGQATELLTIVPAEQGHCIADIIQQSLPEFSVIRATSPLDGRSLWIEVFKKTVSKSQAISWLAQQLGIKQQDVVSIGNDYNDLDMLKWSGKGFVVKNAPKAFKTEFTEVASNNECGVSEAIKQLSPDGCYIKH